MEIISYEDFLENSMTAKVIDMHNPNCTNCNDCCSMTSMILPEEFETLKKYLFKDKVGQKMYKEAKNRLKKIQETTGSIYWICPFSNSNRRCSIYNHRPQICREFHCSADLQENFNKDKFESETHNCIYDLFNKKGGQ